jgi:hypothetical protein
VEGEPGDLERKLADFRAYYNAARSHASPEGHTPLTFTGEHRARTSARSSRIATSPSPRLAAERRRHHRDAEDHGGVRHPPGRIVPHFTGPIATAGHMQTMMAFPGQVLMEYNLGERPVPYLPEFLECRDGKVWPNDRPGLGVTVDERQLAFVEAITEEPPALRSGGSTDR